MSIPEELRVVRQHDERRLGLPNLVWLVPRPPAPTRSLEGILETHLATALRLYGLTDRSDFALRERHDTGRGPLVAIFDQIIDGAPVYPGGLRLAMNREQWLVGVSGTAVPNALSSARSADRGTAIRALLRGHEAVTETQSRQESFREIASRGGYRIFESAELAEPARIRPVWFHLPDRLVSAWHVELFLDIEGTTNTIGYGQIIAGDGTILFRKNLLSHGAPFGTPFTYGVFADADWPHAPFDGPRGNDGSPHPTGALDGFVPDFVSQNAVTLLHGPISTGDPWLPEGATETNGNNADAYVDSEAPSGYDPDLGDIRGTLTAPNTFGWVFDPDSDRVLESQRRFAAVNLFYMVNWLHDYFYDSGFDEIAGNGQKSNYGRGGLENDDIRAEAQDFFRTNNASMATPADGGRPTMQMHLYDHADGSLDNTIVAHEWGHYLTNRLIGNSSGLENNQGRAMGEGWSDFLSLFIMMREEDALLPGNENFGGAYPRGTYANNGRFDNTYYYGNRRYPYSTDMARFNPLSFRHIEDGISLPPFDEIPVRFVVTEENNSQIHASGEVWCVSLWECWTTLLNRPDLTFDEAKRRMADYLVTSLKLTPINPTYTEARDAVLIAAAANDQTDFENFAAAFAKRGLGAEAVSPDRFDVDHLGVVESFEPVTGSPNLIMTSATVVENDRTCDGDGVVDAGEPGVLLLHFENRGSAPSPETFLVITSEDVQFTEGNQRSISETEVLAARQISVPFVFPLSSEIVQITFTVTGLEDGPHEFRFRGNYDYVPGLSKDDDGENGLNAWSREQGTPVVNENWSVVEVAPFEHAWFAPDLSTSSDLYLVSPELVVDESGVLDVRFRHRFSFEPGDWDGGVIELKVEGEVWFDASDFLSVGYNGTIRDNPASPIRNRPAYVRNSPAYPDFSEESLYFPAREGSTVRLRFRLGTDAFTGGEGWAIDDIRIQGISNLPFGRFLPEQDTCSPCYLTDSGALTAFLNSVGRNEWPQPNSILTYLTDYLNNLCEP